MELVKPARTNWKKLDRLLDIIIDAINDRTPSKGNGILLTGSPKGFMIAIDPAATTNPSAGANTAGNTGSSGTGTDAGPDIAGWNSVALIDQSDCSLKYIWYWGTAPSATLGSPPLTRPFGVTYLGQ